MKRLNKCNYCKGTRLINIYSQEIKCQKPWSNFIKLREFPFVINAKICASCGWIFKDYVFNSNELASLYNLDDEKLSEEAKSMADKNAKYRGKQMFKAVEKWMPKSGKILDVGGRNGELMETFLTEGYKISVLDMDAGEPISKEISKIRSPFLEWNKGQYDLITMSHVLEHTEKPRDFLMHSRQLLHDTGLIFIEVPSEMITCLIKRHVGDHRHLCYFTRETLKAYITSSGFECLYCELLIDVVGSRIPLLRAVGRKIDDHNFTKPSKENRYAFLRSITDLFHPLPWLSRIRNTIKHKRS